MQSHRAGGGDRKGGSCSQSDERRTRDPDDRVDDAGALSRKCKGRLGSRSAIQEPAKKSLARRITAREARRDDGREPGRKPTDEQISDAIDGFLAIGGFLDEGLKQQTQFDLEAFEAAIGRELSAEERETFLTTQLQANRWTYIGSGMVHLALSADARPCWAATREIESRRLHRSSPEGLKNKRGKNIMNNSSIYTAAKAVILFAFVLVLTNSLFAQSEAKKDQWVGTSNSFGLSGGYADDPTRMEK